MRTQDKDLRLKTQYLRLLNRFFNVPYECPEPEHWAILIEGFKFCEKWIDLTVFHNRYYRACKSGPCMATVVRLSVLAAASLHIAEGCVSSTVALGQDIHYLFIVCLVEGYEY